MPGTLQQVHKLPPTSIPAQLYGKRLISAASAEEAVRPGTQQSSRESNTLTLASLLCQIPALVGKDWDLEIWERDTWIHTIKIVLTPHVPLHPLGFQKWRSGDCQEPVPPEEQ